MLQYHTMDLILNFKTFSLESLFILFYINVYDIFFFRRKSIKNLFGLMQNEITDVYNDLVKDLENIRYPQKCSINLINFVIFSYLNYNNIILL